MVQQVPVGSSGKTRSMRDFGAGGVVETEEIVGTVPELLAQILRELRVTNKLLDKLVDEDIDLDDERADSSDEDTD